MKYCWASTWTGSITPPSGRSRKVAAAAAATATDEKQPAAARRPHSPYPRLLMRIASCPTSTATCRPSRRCSGTSTAKTRRRGLVPGRPGRLRRPARRLRGARGDRSTCALPATTTWSSRRHRHRLLRGERRGRRPLDDRDDHRGDARLPAARSSRSDRPRAGLYHASPRDPVWEYVLSTRQADDCLDAERQRVARSATHTWRSVHPRRRGQDGGRARAGGAEVDLSDGRWLVTPAASASHATATHGRLAHARHRDVDGRASAASSTRSRTRPGDRRGRACRAARRPALLRPVRRRVPAHTRAALRFAALLAALGCGAAATKGKRIPAAAGERPSGASSTRCALDRSVGACKGLPGAARRRRSGPGPIDAMPHDWTPT